MAILHGYFDASGTELERPVLVAAGAIGEVGDWTSFDGKWLTEMRDEFGVTAFHMVDFAHFTGPFAVGWRDNKEKRDRFLGKLIEYAAWTVQKHYVSTLVIDDYRRYDGKYCLTETFGGPYALAQANCVGQVLDWLIEERESDGFAILVEHGDVGQDAFRRLIRAQYGPVSSSVQIVAKKNDEGHDISPFHIPDFLAYEYRIKHAAMAETGKLPEKARESLRKIEATLYPKVGIVNAEAIERMIEIANVPKRPCPPGN